MLLALSVMAQTTQQSGTATITGMVKVGEAPAAGVAMALIANQIGQANRGGGRPTPGAEPQDQTQNLIQTVTDENGIYRFTGLRAGGYRVMPMTETLVAAAGNAQGFGGAGNPPGFGGSGKAVTVSDGQVVSQIDFTMARGGVITGRVTDNNGRPVIAERINLTSVNETGQPRPAFGGNRAGVETDDRGVYRAYGLPAGKYLVSAGNDGGNRIAPGQARRANYPRTFYPSATEQAEAQVIEVTAGGEIEGIDIVLGGPLKAYAVTGRAVDAQTGQPVSGVPISAAKVARGGRGAQMPGPANTGTTNEKGEFRIAGLLPGTYSISVPAMSFAGGTPASSEYFSETTSFEITSDDTSGVELRVHRGSSITGTVVIEGANDPSQTARLSQLMVFATSRNQGQQGQGPRQAPGQTSGRNGMGQVGSDGIFRVSGLAPGVVRLSVNGGGFGGNGTFRLLRIERNGSPTNGDIEIVSGESVTGVRVVVAFASAVIQGRVVISGGTLPAGTRLNVTARPVNSAASTGGGNNARLEANGQFRIENLLPGAYEVRVTANTFGGEQGGRGGRPAQGGQAPTQPQIRIPEVRQTVTVTNGTPANVTLTLNLAQ
jgi:protocatechuate 3,4-dioxygenase beta subunit